MMLPRTTTLPMRTNMLWVRNAKPGPTRGEMIFAAYVRGPTCLASDLATAPDRDWEGRMYVRVGARRSGTGLPPDAEDLAVDVGQRHAEDRGHRGRDIDQAGAVDAAPRRDVRPPEHERRAHVRAL